jgi:hypothetical protein
VQREEVKIFSRGLTLYVVIVSFRKRWVRVWVLNCEETSEQVLSAEGEERRCLTTDSKSSGGILGGPIQSKSDGL